MPFKASNNSDNRGYADDTFRFAPTIAIRRQFCAFVQGLFAASDDRYKWDINEDTTQIIIRDENPIDVSSFNLRPAINFTRGLMPAQQLGFNNMTSMDMRTNTMTKSIMGASVMTINCSAAQDLESEAIAFIVWSHIVALGELLVRNGFFAIEAPTLGAPSSGSDVVVNSAGKEWYTTSVSVPFRINHMMQITPLNQRIGQSILLRMHTALNPLNQTPTEDVWHGQPALAVLEQKPAPPGGPDFMQAARVPLPNNPAATRRAVVAAPHSGTLRQPAVGGRTLPLEDSGVEQSSGSSSETWVGPPPENKLGA